MDCSYFDAGVCRSCQLLPVPYLDQVSRLQHEVAQKLGDGVTWLPPVKSAESGFRNKAKMAVGGTVAEPTLGIVNRDGSTADLRECGLHDPRLQAALPVLAAFITKASITPYDVSARRGELKHLLVTVSEAGELLVRFVLRSSEPVLRIRKHLDWLLSELPIAVASINLQTEHKAILEGPEEIVLTERETLPMAVNGRVLHLRPQSFFQTNTEVAAALYRAAADHVDAVNPASVWDLYCGVGGFGLHVAAPGRAVLGVESSAQAIESAKVSSAELGIDAEWLAADATEFALAAEAPAELVIVNPPRRGIGATLATWLNDSSVKDVVYSSCNPTTLAADLTLMPDFEVLSAQLLDMFPHTEHAEVLVLLSRKASPNAASAAQVPEETPAQQSPKPATSTRHQGQRRTW